jgi:hypothetical protein
MTAAFRLAEQPALPPALKLPTLSDSPDNDSPDDAGVSRKKTAVKKRGSKKSSVFIFLPPFFCLSLEVCKEFKDKIPKEQISACITPKSVLQFACSEKYLCDKNEKLICGFGCCPTRNW